MLRKALRHTSPARHVPYPSPPVQKDTESSTIRTNMFEPPDFPFKEISDVLRNNYDASDLLYQADESICLSEPHIENTKDEDIYGPETLFFHSNDSGRYFNSESYSCTDIASTVRSMQPTELFIVQSDNLLSYEPTQLDENTVNQFILPLQVTNGASKEDECVTALIALQSCTICNEIFTSPADLWDHTVAAHYTENIVVNGDEARVNTSEPDESTVEPEEPLIGEAEAAGPQQATGQLSETEWLVCSVCERVLSIAVEVEDTICCCTGAADTRTLQTLYACDWCSVLFANDGALATHRGACIMDAQQPDTRPSDENSQGTTVWYLCNSCNQPHSSPEELIAHIDTCVLSTDAPPHAEDVPTQSAPSTKMWNCGSCNQLFSTARELYRHKRGEDRLAGSEITTYICEECDKALGSLCALHTHRKTHKVTKPGYPCKICGRRFNQSGHLAIHMRMHTGERPYPCDMCPKAFKVKVERDDHRRTHTGERPFVCGSCGKTFTAAARLREHSRIHTDQRPYRCEICGAAFRRPYARTVHTLIHTGEKPHECDVCGTAFRRSGDMWKHKRTLHGTSDDRK